jgi:hypothetical protein
VSRGSPESGPNPAPASAPNDPGGRRDFFPPWLYPGSLVLLILPFFIGYFRGRLVFIPYPEPAEFFDEWYPYLRFIGSMWRSGQPPLWTHNLQCGFPFAAFPHAAAFYPPAALFILTRFTTAFPLFILFHMTARVLFTWLLLREWGYSRFASWLGAAMFGLAGISMHIVGWMVMFDTSTWVPALFWLGLRISRRSRTADFLGLAAVSALMYLAGDTEILLYSWIVLLAVLILIERAGWPRAVLVLAALAAGVLICAAPLLLTLNYLHHSARQAQSFNPLGTQWPFLGLLLAAPFAYSLVPLEGVKHFMYPGLLLSLGLLAAVGERERRRTVLASAAVFLGLVVYFANFWPLSYVFNELPVLRYAEVGMRFRVFFPGYFLLLAVAARGFERLTAGLERRPLRPAAWFVPIFVVMQALAVAFNIHAAKALGAVEIARIVFLIALIALAVIVRWKSRSSGRVQVRPAWLVIILLLDLYAVSWLDVPRADAGLLRTPVSHPALAKTSEPGRLQMVTAMILGEAKTDMWRMLRLDEGPGFVIGFIRNGLARQVEIKDALNQASVSFFTPNYIRPQTVPLLNYLAVDYVLSDATPVWNSDPVRLDSPLLPSAYRVRQAYAGARPPAGKLGYLMAPGSEWAMTTAVEFLPGDGLAMTVFPEEAAACLTIGIGAEAGSALRTATWSQAVVDPDTPGRAILMLPSPVAGDDHLMIAVAEQCPGPVQIDAIAATGDARPLKEIWRDGYRLYQNRDRLDHYGLYTAVTVAEAREAKAILFDPARFEPSRRLIIEPAALDPAIAGTTVRERQPGDVKVREYQSNSVRLETDLPAPAYLSIAESYYPGWRAWVDGRPAPIIRANYFCSAVPLAQPGPHRIELRFLPLEFRLGLWASLAALALLLASAVGHSALKSIHGG